MRSACHSVHTLSRVWECPTCASADVFASPYINHPQHRPCPTYVPVQAARPVPRTHPSTHAHLPNEAGLCPMLQRNLLSLCIIQVGIFCPLGNRGGSRFTDRGHDRLCIGVEEELEVSHSAFHKAFEDAKPEKAQVPGLQEFAASIWARRRQIPSSTRDPVTHIFDEVGLHVGRVGRISHLTHGTDCLSHPAV